MLLSKEFFPIFFPNFLYLLPSVRRDIKELPNLFRDEGVKFRKCVLGPCLIFVKLHWVYHDIKNLSDKFLILLKKGNKKIATIFMGTVKTGLLLIKLKISFAPCQTSVN